MGITVTVNSGINVNPNTDIVINLEGGLTGVFTEVGNQVFAWCTEVGIDADLLGHWYDNDKYHSAWRILDEQQRMMFALKWT